MKMKKVIALILTLAMFASMLAISPVVSAEDTSKWEPLVENGVIDPDNTPAPAGYERIRVNAQGNTRRVTKAQYDMTSTTIVLRDVSIPSNNWGSLTFSNTQKAGAVKSDAANGTLTFLLRKTSAGLKFIVYTSTGAEGSSTTAALADEYEISFVKTGSTWRLRVNNNYLTNQEDIIKFCESGLPSYIGLHASSYFGGSYKIVDNNDMKGRWIPTSTHKLYDKDGVAVADNNATGFKFTTDKCLSISSLAKYDMLENALVIEDLSLSKTNDWNLISFTTTRTNGYDPLQSETRIGMFWTPILVDTDGDGTKDDYTQIKVSLSLNIEKDVAINRADKYVIRFRKIGSKYRMYINDTLVPTSGAHCADLHNALQTYCTNGNINNTYVNIRTSKTMYANISLVSNDTFKGEWLTAGTNKCTPTINADNSATVTVDAFKNITTAAKYNLLRGKLTLKDTTIVADKNVGNVVVFGSITAGIAKATDEFVCVAIFPETITDGVIEKVKIRVLRDDGGWTDLGTIDAATDYTFTFVKEDGNYILCVNGNKMKTNSLLTSYGTSGILENCYISVTSQNTLKTTLSIAESSWEQVGKTEATANWIASDSEMAIENGSFADDGFVRYQEKLDIRNTSITIEGLEIADSTTATTVTPNAFGKGAALIFAKSENIGNMAVASTDVLTFAFRSIKNDTEDLIQIFNINNSGGWEALGSVPAADKYEISVIYSDANGYTLNVNGTVLGKIKWSDGVNFFGKGDTEAYVLFGATATSVTADKISLDETEGVVGDVNGDGVRDIEDMVMIECGATEGSGNADADQDGEVGANDITTIRKIWFLGGLNGYTYVQ